MREGEETLCLITIQNETFVFTLPLGGSSEARGGLFPKAWCMALVAIAMQKRLTQRRGGAKDKRHGPWFSSPRLGGFA
jgi:hypothetical protein